MRTGYSAIVWMSRMIRLYFNQLRYYSKLYIAGKEYKSHAKKT